jgi:hypothetical protein
MRAGMSGNAAPLGLSGGHSDKSKARGLPGDAPIKAADAGGDHLTDLSTRLDATFA